MKSFDKFQYGRTNLHEIKIGEPTGVKAQTAGNNPGLRKTAETGRQLDPRRALPSAPEKPLSPNVSKGESTGPQRQQRAKASGQKAGPAPTGIARVMARNKKKLKDKASSEGGRAAGRALAGAAKALFNYNPDKERTDTGQGGMGTAKRQRSGFLKSAIKGGVDAPSERINPKQRKTLGGKLLALGKEKLQDRVGIEPTARTGQGRKVTGGTSRATDRERTRRIAKNVAKTGYKDEEQTKRFVGTAPTIKSTQITGMSDADLAKRKPTGDEGQFKSNRKVTGNKDFETFKKENNPDQQRRLMYGNQQGSSSESMPSTNDNANTSTTRRRANVTSVKRSNQGRPEGTKNKSTQLSFIRRLFGRNKSSTKKEETMNLSKILEANRIAAEREIRNQYGSVTNAQMRTPDQMKKDDARKKLLQNRNNNVMQNNQSNESYSHWREEFIWETDKKYPEKMKEIKPMSGKNTITINPEDESSKYKRGY